MKFTEFRDAVLDGRVRGDPCTTRRRFVDIDTLFIGVIGIDKVIDLQVSIDTCRFTVRVQSVLLHN